MHERRVESETHEYFFTLKGAHGVNWFMNAMQMQGQYSFRRLKEVCEHYVHV